MRNYDAIANGLINARTHGIVREDESGPVEEVNSSAMVVDIRRELAQARIDGMYEAGQIATSRASHYAQAANKHQGEILGDVYTEKCGVSASIASAIDARIAALQSDLDGKKP